MTYQLRRLRLHDLIVRIPGSNRYTVTQLGLRFPTFYIRLHARILRPGLSDLAGAKVAEGPLDRHFERLEKALDQWIERAA